MDNTLLDADRVHVLAFNKAFKKNGLRKVKAKKLKKLFGMIGEELVKKLFPKLKKQEIKKIVDDHNDMLLKETKKYIKPFRGVKRTLRRLKKRYKLALISNCTRREILTLLKTAKVDEKLFSAILGNDQVKKPKPAPDPIFKVEKLLHLNADYMVGDTIYDIIAGKKAKVVTIAVLTGDHTLEELARYKPNYIIKSVNQLPKILR